jgi:hypothetical protein
VPADRAGHDQPEANDHRDRMLSNRAGKSSRPLFLRRRIGLFGIFVRVFASGGALLTLRTDIKPVANRLLVSRTITGPAAIVAVGTWVDSVDIAGISGTHKASQSIEEKPETEHQGVKRHSATTVPGSEMMLFDTQPSVFIASETARAGVAQNARSACV